MSLLDLTPEQRAAEDAAMPGIFADGFHPDRIDWYTRLVIEDGRVRGGVEVIPELIAAMIMESGLKNREFGDSDKTNPNFGVGWMQHDTGYTIPDIATLVALRADPLNPLGHTLANPDLARQGGRRTWFNKQRWHAWEREIIDPTSGWSPLDAAHDAWDRVTA